MILVSVKIFIFFAQQFPKKYRFFEQIDTVKYCSFLQRIELKPIRICSSLEINADHLLLCHATTIDLSILEQKLLFLSPPQSQYLKKIIHSYIAATALNNNVF